jgi:hypothetical protein
VAGSDRAGADGARGAGEGACALRYVVRRRQVRTTYCDAVPGGMTTCHQRERRDFERAQEITHMGVRKNGGTVLGTKLQ